MDKYSQCCGYIKNGKISIRILKDLKNNNWLVNKIEKSSVIKNKSRKSLVVPKKSAPNARHTLRISIPIEIYWKAMQNQKNAEFIIPRPNETEARRPPSPNPMMRPPLPLNASGLRTVRHQVPTGKSRITMADKLEQIIRAPQPIHSNIAIRNPVYISPLNLHLTTPPTKKIEKNIIEEMKTGSNKIDIPTTIKHKLPLTVVPLKGCYGSRLSNPVDKENELNNPNKTKLPLTNQATTQTDKIFIVTDEDSKILQLVKGKNITEEDFQILDIVKESGVTIEKLGKQLDRLKKQQDSNNDSDCVMIDLESNTEENSINNELMKKCHTLSNNNKYLMLSLMNCAHAAVPPIFPVAPVTPVPAEHSAATTEQPAASIINIESSSRSSTPCPKTTITYDDILKSLNFLVILKKMGLCLTCNTLEQTHTIDANNQFTQTEDENDNKKRKISGDDHSNGMIAKQNSFQHAPVIATEPQEGQQTVPVPQQKEQPKCQQLQQLQLQPPLLQPPQLQPQQIQPPPQQLQQPQMQPYMVQKHFERPVQFYTLRSRNMRRQQHAQFASMRNHYQSSFQQNRNKACTPQPPALMPRPIQLSPADPRRHSLQNQMSFTGQSPCLARVLSTDEANQAMHGLQAVSHQDWSYPSFYDTQSNYWPPGHH